MKELDNIAANYAAEKTNEVMTSAIAQAYADGYRDGYKDREEEIPVDLRDDKIEFVDLGLPSGTKWSKNYVEDDNGYLYVPYGVAETYSIPTEEQCKELLNTCEWESKFHSYSQYNGYRLDVVKCVGPNGNYIEFKCAGRVKANEISDYYRIFFWIKDENEGNDKKVVHIYNPSSDRQSIEKIIGKLFSGYKLPIRLVSTKK